MMTFRCEAGRDGTGAMDALHYRPNLGTRDLPLFAAADLPRTRRAPTRRARRHGT